MKRSLFVVLGLVVMLGFMSCDNPANGNVNGDSSGGQFVAVQLRGQFNTHEGEYISPYVFYLLRNMLNGSLGIGQLFYVHSVGNNLYQQRNNETILLGTFNTEVTPITFTFAPTAPFSQGTHDDLSEFVMTEQGNESW